MRNSTEIRKFVAAGAIAMALNGCGPVRQEPDPIKPVLPPTPTSQVQKPEVKPTVLVIKPESTVVSRETWKILSSKERIQLLEAKKYPTASAEPFDPTKELVQASAEFFCETIGCTVPPSEMANKVRFLETEDFIKEAEKDLNRQYTEQEKNTIRSGGLEKVTQDKTILMHKTLFEKIAHEQNASQSESIKQLQRENIDFQTAHTKSILFHAFGHFVESSGAYIPDSPVTIPHPQTKEILTVVKIDNHLVSSRVRDQSFSVSGGSEAFTDWISSYVSRKASRHVGITGNYDIGRAYITQLKQFANISDEELIDYHTGRKPIKEFIHKLGSIKDPKNPNEESGLRIYGIVALATSEVITREVATGMLQEEIGLIPTSVKPAPAKK